MRGASLSTRWKMPFIPFEARVHLPKTIKRRVTQQRRAYEEEVRDAYKEFNRTIRLTHDYTRSSKQFRQHVNRALHLFFKRTELHNYH